MTYVSGEWTNQHVQPSKEERKREFDRRCKPFLEPLSRAIHDGMKVEDILRIVNDADRRDKIESIRQMFETLANTGLYKAKDIRKNLEILESYGCKGQEVTEILGTIE